MEYVPLWISIPLLALIFLAIWFAWESWLWKDGPFYRWYQRRKKEKIRAKK